MKVSHDQITGWIWIGISIFVCISSWGLGIGTLSSPDAGFFPFIAAALLGGISLISLMAETLSKASARNSDASYRRFNLKRPLVVFTTLILYTFILNIIGYLISTFILFCLLFNVVPSMKRRNWWFPVLGSFVTVLVSYIVFDKLLLVLLPKGIFGF